MGELRCRLHESFPLLRGRSAREHLVSLILPRLDEVTEILFFACSLLGNETLRSTQGDENFR